MFVLSGNSCISTVLTDLDLSSSVSVPTSRRPIEFGSTLYFLSRLETTVRENEYISGSTCHGGGLGWRGQGALLPSRSSQKAILVWPRPIVYFPVLTPSYFSSSDCSTYWREASSAGPG